MTTTISKSYTATGNSTQLLVKDDNSVTYVITGSATATWVVEYTWNQLDWTTIATGTADATIVTYLNARNDSRPIWVRSRCSAFTSGTMVVAIADVKDPIRGFDDVVDNDGVTIRSGLDEGFDIIRRVDQQYIITSGAKLGGTAGGAVDAANDKGSLFSVPASQTASTIVVKIPALKAGWIITGMGVIGQAESAGGALTVDANLRAQTAVAAGNTDASIASITQIAKTADYLINDEVASLSHTVIDTEAYYILCTVTTAASTDVDMLSVYLNVTEV